MNSIYKATTDGETSTIGYKIQSNVLGHIQDGKAVLNVTLGRKGMEAWIQFLDPDLVHKTYDLESASEYIQEQAKGKGKQVVRDEVEIPVRQKQQSLVSVDDDFPGRVTMDLEEAERRVKDKKLNFHRTQGVLNKYPVKSLVNNDFKRENQKDFVARVVVVANNIGTDKMLNRLTTDPRFRINGVKTLSEWWDRASWEQKLLSVTNAKDFNWSLTSNTTRINQVGFPFQEADLGTVADEESGWSS